MALGTDKLTEVLLMISGCLALNPLNQYLQALALSGEKPPCLFLAASSNAREQTLAGVRGKPLSACSRIRSANSCSCSV